VSLILAACGLILPILLAILVLLSKAQSDFHSITPSLVGLCLLLCVVCEGLALIIGRSSRNTLSGKLGVRIATCLLVPAGGFLLLAFGWVLFGKA
jgi:hypothetical protein